MSIDIRHLKHFEAVYRLRSFIRAAEEQLITQSALTKSIKALEYTLGDKLFDRTTNSVKPTDVGRDLIVEAKEVISALHMFENKSKQLVEGLSGCVNVGSGPYPIQQLLTSVLHSFSQDHKAIQVIIHTGGPNMLLTDLVERQLDMVISDISKFETMSFFKKIDITSLTAEPLVIIHHADHPVKYINNLEEMVDFPWVLPRYSSHFARIVDAIKHKSDHTIPFPLYILEVPSACIELCINGEILTTVPYSLAKSSCEKHPELRMKSLPPAFQTNDGIHALKNKTLSPAARLFKKYIEKEAEKRKAC